MTEKMEYWEVESFAPTWGSYMTAGDPGACLYGFDRTGRPQSEGHRADCIREMEKNRARVVESPDDFDEDELDKIDSFLAWIKEANPLDGGDRDLANLKDEFRLTGSGDVWGNAMSWWFAVAHEMRDRGLTIPDEWQFRPGAGHSDATQYEGECCQQADEFALEEFGAILTRYVRYLKFKGKDY